MDATTAHDPQLMRRRHELIERATRVVEVPRANPADSFVLHASLNLMARIGLLGHVDPEALPAAEAAIETMVERYQSSGPAVSPPRTLSLTGVEEAARRLGTAIEAGDLDHVDALASWLTAHGPIATLTSLLGEAVIDSLAAAGHVPIGFHLLRRVNEGSLSPSLLRGPLRELARHPEWKIRWFRDLRDPAEPEPLTTALASLPYVGPPESDFIFPLMSQIEQEKLGPLGLGPALGPVPDVASASRVLLRAAALSMLHGDPARAPYGWSHCFTMPQGALSLANRGVEARTAVAVAATFVAGFRIAYRSEPFGSLGDEAAVEWVLSDTTGPNQTELANFASQHHDEHLVKYTLACFHAAEDDPAWRTVYLQAAAYLADWWRANPDAGFS